MVSLVSRDLRSVRQGIAQRRTVKDQERRREIILIVLVSSALERGIKNCHAFRAPHLARPHPVLIVDIVNHPAMRTNLGFLCCLLL